MIYYPHNRTNALSRTSRVARTTVSLSNRYLRQFARIRHVGIGLMILICTWSSWVNAEQSEESENVADACDIAIAPIDQRQLASDPEKTKARVIARMLQDMDRCIGAHQSQSASANQGNAQGVSPSLISTQNGSQSSTSRQTASSKQAQSHAHQASVESATTDSDATHTSSAEPIDTTLADIVRDATRSSTSIQHNTNVFDFGSDDELVHDDYAKTLHEAYLAETDPVLKEALGKELTNYLNNKKQ